MQAEPRHIVDELIEERAQHLMQHPRLWRGIKRWGYPLLGYEKAIDAVDSVHGMGGYEIFDWLSETLALHVDSPGVENIPKKGLAFMMPNHPAGMADGVAVYDAVRRVREDVVFFANRDCIRVAPGLSDIIIPVEWRTDQRDIARNRETVRAMASAFHQEKLVVIFPAGRMSRLTMGGLREQPWFDSGVSLALKYRAPIVPMHINARSSLLFYALHFINTELKDMTLFRELLEKAGYHYKLTTGEAFVPDGDAAQINRALQSFVEDDLSQGKTTFHFEEPDTEALPSQS
ncbi:MAG: 1-acyl-sn-glycerol-3-phosphate acyltransferase [Pseudomonadaceae bacterium]|nr:1-acyl-sn-glycerol-3-phosphate acyltransferase [Pseudomonadaceae bacterium]